MSEMRPDSLRGYSGGIRITRRLPEFFGSTDLLFSGLGREQIRRFIHEAEDFVVFSPFCIKTRREVLPNQRQK
jgi:hypothetical protein